jgi:hypothetical protein
MLTRFGTGCHESVDAFDPCRSRALALRRRSCVMGFFDIGVVQDAGSSGQSPFYRVADLDGYRTVTACQGLCFADVLFISFQDEIGRSTKKSGAAAGQCCIQVKKRVSRPQCGVSLAVA